MSVETDGRAIVYCQGAFNTPYGKTAHGLVRFTRRYRVLSVVDAAWAGSDAGEVLDAQPSGIPVVATVEAAVQMGAAAGTPATHLVIGLAPDGGRLAPGARDDVRRALALGLNVDSGLHDFLSEDPELDALARQMGVRIRDVRRPPPRGELHFFSGKIEQVRALKIAVLGTDSAVGKRTTAWKIVEGFAARDTSTALIGTGQTAWMQGAAHSIVMDSLVNDFVSGEIEHAVWSAWNDGQPAVIVIEGQGSLMNPAYPGGFEILAAGRPDVIVLQHAPARRDYDGFAGYRIQPLWKQIQVIELLAGKPVVAVAVNHENLAPDRVPCVCDGIEKAVGLPAVDVLLEGPAKLIDTLAAYLNRG